MPTQHSSPSMSQNGHFETVEVLHELGANLLVAKTNGVTAVIHTPLSRQFGMTLNGQILNYSHWSFLVVGESVLSSLISPVFHYGR